MEINVNKYAQAKIYKIESVLGGLVYYGSTRNDLYTRMGMHKGDHKKFQAGKHRRITAFDVLVHPDARILLVEAFPCSNKQELTAREAWYIRNNDCVNKVIPGRTHREYRQENKRMITEKKKQPKHCETCNCWVGAGVFYIHRRSQKHIANSASIVSGGGEPDTSDNQDEVDVDRIVLPQ
jgi:GIY-YIG catalytic domain